MARQPCVTIVFGQKGVGKTIKTINLIRDYVFVSPKRKALIFDVNNEFAKFRNKNFKDELQNYDTIKSLRIADIAAFSNQVTPEVRRIRPFWDDGKKMTIDDMSVVLGVILDNFKNGLLLVEDINKYTSVNMKKDLLGALATSRHIGIDLIAHYQLISRAANPTLVGMSNYFRVHRTSDNPYSTRIKENLEEKFELVAIAYEMVKNKYLQGKKNGQKIYYDLTTDNDSFKIKGVYTKTEALKGIENFISQDPNTISRRMNMLDRTGKPLYKDYKQAFAEYEQELFETYF